MLKNYTFFDPYSKLFMQKIFTERKPMNSTHLLNSFTRSLYWNCLSYAAQRTSNFITTIILHKTLSSGDFCIWANSNSLIYLSLLWIDCGMRKSIPRYMSEFTKERTEHKKFILRIITGQTILLMIAAPLITHIAQFNPIAKTEYEFALLCAALFFTEGINNILRLIFHAHFWNKQSNTIATCATVAQMITAISTTHTIYSNTIYYIVASQCIIGTIAGILLIAKLKTLFNSSVWQQSNTPINTSVIYSNWLKHSAIMWANNALKSLSERNILVPFFTYTFGTNAANIYKIANDGALCLYRIAIKTIGTSDTAVLAYAYSTNEEKKLMQVAFKKLSSKIAGLSFPFLAFAFALFLNRDDININPAVFLSFFIMTVGYMTEFTMSMYERVLEVCARYMILAISYMPYIICILSILIYKPILPFIGFTNSLLIMHGVRLVSSLIMLILARMQYPLLLMPPLIPYLLRALLICLVSYIGIRILCFLFLSKCLIPYTI
jgi:hypothetical protein